MIQQLTNENIRMEYRKSVNYALSIYEKKVLTLCEVTNNDTDDWHDIRMSVTGDMFSSTEVRLDLIPKGGMVNVEDLSVSPSLDKLRSVTEGLDTQFTLQVFIGETEVFHQSYPIHVMPFDQWPGIGSRPEFLAAFVTPNDPSLAPLKIATAKYLEKFTGSSSLDDYQTNDPNRIRKMVAAVYEALREQGIVYITPPPHFEEVGQRVRMTDAVLAHKQGTCLDLSLTFASCLEAIGLNPLLILIQGHMFIGCWLDNRTYPQIYCDDVSFLSKSIADGISEMVVVEATQITQQSVGFEDAVKAAERHIQLEPERFEMAVDITRCRQYNIRPLPKDAGELQANEGLSLDHATDKFQEVHRYDDLEQVGDRQLTRLQIWERKLLDFSLRNNLLNMRIGKNLMPFISFDIEHLEDYLQAKEDFKLLPFPLDKRVAPGDSGIYDSRAHRESMEKMVVDGLKQHQLYSYLNESELQTGLKGLFRASRTALEENGANTLYLVLGLLKWYEGDKSIKPRYAPLLLEPVDLVKKSGNNYVLRVREDDITFNTTLVEMMMQQYDTNMSNVNPLPTDDSGIDVRKVFATVRAAIKDHARWDVVEECLLGLFSFSKFVMWNDIHSNSDKMRQNPVIESLIQKRLVGIEGNKSPNTREVDMKVEPDKYAIPVDVDSSQLEAVIESGEGGSFILYGPPGTGKSQTITNMIANALYHGRRVLFVAEKMAALEVVQRRLAKIGLDPFCLEMHSNKMTKSHLLQQLQSALDVTRIKSPEEYARESKALFEQRKQLIKYVNLLHQRQASGLSLYDYITRYIATPGDELIAPTPKFVEGATAASIEAAEKAVNELSAVFAITGMPGDNPLRGLYVTDPSYEAQQNVRSLLEQVGQLAPNVRTTLRALSQANGITISENSYDSQWAERFADAITATPVANAALLAIAADPSQLQQWQKHVSNGKELERLGGTLTSTYSPDILKLNVRQLKADWVNACDKVFFLSPFAKKKVVKQLRVYRSDITKDEVPTLITQLENYQQLSDSLSALRQSSEQIFGRIGSPGKELWQKMLDSLQAAPNILALLREAKQPATSVNAINTRNIDTTALKQYNALLRSAASYARIDSRLTFDDIILRVPQWLLNIVNIRDWAQWCLRRQQLFQQHLAPVANYIEQGHDSTQACHAMLRGIYQKLAMDIIDHDPDLQMFNGVIFEESIARYRDMAKQFQDITKKALYCKLASLIPSLTIEAASSSEIGYLKRMIASGGRGTTIRQIIDHIPTLLPKLCPCMLMSPISVAQFIDLDQDKFDIVVFDEASQMPTSEAVGAIARGKALIVVGDPKQMPPTSFFTTTTVDESEAENDDMESILDDCITLTFPDHYLTWHYRSRHESLIAFSNSQYYDGKLYTFPSVDDRSSKVTFVPIDGTYDMGKSRCNRAEAEAIVAEVVRRLSDPVLSKKSIGIVSFSKVQQDLIEDILVEQLGQSADLERLAYDVEEPIFVKNLENVQGDERDVILFSVGYGPDKNGHVSMNFGPLNNNGGERRLNVAVSRARNEMVVFSTLQPEQIDLNRSRARGVEGLKRFLEFAKSGRMPVASSQMQQQVDTSLINSIASTLRTYGYEVDTQVGRSRFKIDLAVIDPTSPDNYLMGIICDGTNYHSTHTERDREICQPGVLKGLGWDLMRVWTIDWFLNRQKVTDRIIDRLEEIVRQKAAEKEQAVKGLSDQKATPPITASFTSPVRPASPASPSQASATPRPQASATVKSVEKEIQKMPFSVSEDEIILAASNDKEVPYPETPIEQRYTNRNSDVLALSRRQVETDILRIIKTEQPVTLSMLRKRVMWIYGQSRGSDLLTHLIQKSVMKAYVDPMSATDNPAFWATPSDASGYDKYRKASGRDIDDIPLIEIANVLKMAVTQQVSISSDDLLRQIAKLLGFSRRTPRTDAAIGGVIDRLVSGGIFQITDGIVSNK